MATFAYVLNRDVCGFFERARASRVSRHARGFSRAFRMDSRARAISISISKDDGLDGARVREEPLQNRAPERNTRRL